MERCHAMSQCTPNATVSEDATAHQVGQPRVSRAPPDARAAGTAPEAIMAPNIPQRAPRGCVRRDAPAWRTVTRSAMMPGAASADGGRSMNEHRVLPAVLLTVAAAVAAACSAPLQRPAAAPAPTAAAPAADARPAAAVA